jgi:ABC-type multidrug transport system fused ATPase/permease subunit
MIVNKMADEEKEEPLKVIALDKMAALITAAFGLIAALAWNEAIKAIFKEIFGEADAIGPLLIYAIVVTVAAVILTILVAMQLSKAKKQM